MLIVVCSEMPADKEKARLEILETVVEMIGKIAKPEKNSICERITKN